MRPTWDETWLDTARVIARRSLCTRAQVGAVIVSSTNVIIASGYNGPPQDFEHGGRPCTYWCHRSQVGPTPETLIAYNDCPSLHAESNALSFCDRSTREGGTIYITGAICYTCAKLIANSGLVRVVVGIDSDHDYRNPAASYELLTRLGVEVVVHE